jgi:phosphoglycerate dehydrogenase-like enzyme
MESQTMKVVLFSPEGEAYFHLLDDTGIEDLTVVRGRDADHVLAEMPDTDVFYGFPKREFLDAAPNLKLVQSSSAGVDWVARVEGLAESDLVVANTRGAHAPSIAEHVFALLFALTRDIPQMVAWKQERHWGRVEAYRSLREIKDSTMGILGYGAIGRTIARRAQAFEMRVLAVDAQPGAGDGIVDEVWSTDRLPDLLSQSDVVVVAVPYTPETHHLIDAAALAEMRQDASLIVISRGGIVEEGALNAALRSGAIAGAGIDVTEVEPLGADSPLWDAPNLIITPHVAGASGPKERRCVEILRENLIRLAHGDELVNVIDKRRGY